MNTIHTVVEAAIQHPALPPPDSLVESGAVEVYTQPKLDELVEQIVQAHQSLQAARKAMVKSALELGALLLEARDAVGHGSFMSWVENNFTARIGLSHRSANVYMKLKRFAADNPGELDGLVDGTLKEALAYIDGRTLDLDSQPAANSDFDDDDAEEEGSEEVNQVVADDVEEEHAQAAKRTKATEAAAKKKGKGSNAKPKESAVAKMGFWAALLEMAELIKAGRAGRPQGWETPYHERLRDAAKVVADHLATLNTDAAKGEAH